MKLNKTLMVSSPGNRLLMTQARRRYATSVFVHSEATTTFSRRPRLLSRCVGQTHSHLPSLRLGSTKDDQRSALTTDSNNDSEVMPSFLQPPFVGNNNDLEYVGRTRTKTTTLMLARNAAIAYLEHYNAPEPAESVHQLLAFVMNYDWRTGWKFIRDLDDPKTTTSSTLQFVSPSQLEHLQQLLERRVQHEPLQYILGKWDFLDYTLMVRPPLLSPRPETEELVLMVAKHVQKQLRLRSGNGSTTRPFRILDVGCGSGVIACCLAAMLCKDVDDVTVMITAIDIEPMAVQVTRENAQRLGVGHCVDCELVSAQDYTAQKSEFDLIVSNPPYIPPRDMETLDRTVQDYESRLALVGGECEDGMDIIRTIVKQFASSWTTSTSTDNISTLPTTATCWMEVDPSQPTHLQEWLQNDPSVEFVDTYKDMYGRDRFVQIRRRRQSD